MIEQFTKQSQIENGYISAKKKVINGKHKTHWHEFFEIEYMISGEGTYSIDGKDYKITEDMLFFMTPVNFHSVDSQNVQVYNVMFSESICDSYFLARLLSCEYNAIKLDTDSAKIIKALMEELVSVADDKHHASYLISCILAKLGNLYKERTERLAPVSEATLYVIRNFRSAPSLEETAAHVGFAPSYFSEIFKKQTGENYKSFLDNIRFDYAKRLLLFTDMTILEICGESGFNDYANFVRRFKKRFGVSPSRLRKG